MKKLIGVVSVIFFTLPIVAMASGSHAVKGSVRKNGTYVAPHHATNPDKVKINNYSTKGNTNPYTGKNGTKDPNKK